MSIKALVGFETGGTSECSATTGTVSVQTSIKRSGGYAGRANPTTTATGAFASEFIGSSSPVGGGGSNMYTRFYYYCATRPAANDEEMFRCNDATPVLKLAIRQDTSGVIKVYDTNNTLIATGTTVLSTATWYRFNVRVGTGASAAYEIYINGMLEASSTTANLGTSGGSRLWYGKFANNNGNSIDFYYDDILTDSATHVGPGMILQHLPISNGTSMQWTTGTGASNQTQVNEVPVDDTTYVKSTGTAGDIALFNFQSTGTVGASGRVNAVEVLTRMREEATSVTATKVRILSNGVTSDAPTVDLTSSASVRCRILTTDPLTGGPFTLADVDQIQGGAVEVNAVASRLTTTLLNVDYTLVSDMPHSRGAMGCGR